MGYAVATSPKPSPPLFVQHQELLSLTILCKQSVTFSINAFEMKMQKTSTSQIAYWLDYSILPRDAQAYFHISVITD